MKITKAETLTVDLTEEEIVRLVLDSVYKSDCSPSFYPKSGTKGELYSHKDGTYWVEWEVKESLGQ